MLKFSPCKINLGLNIVEKRPDGFHNLETVFYTIGWNDILEVIETTDNQDFNISFSGLTVPGSLEENILHKTMQLVQKDYKLPHLKVHLHKNIPMGAGLGGGSSNAATFINLLDEKFNLQIPLSKKLDYAQHLGSDCAYFIENKTSFATGKGELLNPISLNLNTYYILIVYPGIHCNTKLAFAGITPQQPKQSCKRIIETLPMEEWKTHLTNDFEKPMFKQYPEIESLKNKLYSGGAIYASMSGSGSSVFGIFKEKPNVEIPKEYASFLQVPK